MNPVLLALAAAPAPSTTAVAIGIAGIVSIVSPLLLKAVPWSGAQMTALTMLVALAVAILASWLTGDLAFTRDGIVTALTGGSVVWTVQQAVYATLKQVAPATVGATPAPHPTPA